MAPPLQARLMSYTAQRYDFRDKSGDYGRLAQDLTGLLAGESDRIANAANTAALIFAALPEINWAGFYFLRGTELVLGPCQGKPACVRIGLGQGVCGAAAHASGSGRAEIPRTHRLRCRLARGDRRATTRGHRAHRRAGRGQPGRRALR